MVYYSGLIGPVRSIAMERYAHDQENRFAWVKYALLGALALATTIVVFVAVTR